MAVTKDLYQENRGSEWHKWDLHVHTPASGLNNQFGGDTEDAWDRYVKTLFTTAIANEVSVIGITDYFLIDGYKKLKQNYLNDDARLLSLFGDKATIAKVKQIRLLPNIEFRLDKLVNKNRVNYHVVLSDELAIEDIEDDFLGKLNISIDQNTSGIDHKETLSRRGLEKLGAVLKKQESGFTGSDYEVGCGTAAISDDEIRRVLHENAKFLEKYIIVTPVDEDLCKISWGSQGHNIKKTIYQHSHAFFTSNPNTREFALGRKHPSIEDYLKEFKSFKPCFIGSDSHSIDDIEQKLGRWDIQRHDQSRITWIKAFTTFDGLRQTLFEPETRVSIQSTRPEPKPDMHVISSIKFKGTNTTFDSNSRILLNENLNTIIGGKSSGKSLLMYAMAKTVNSEQVDNYYRILKLDGYEDVNDFELEWKDGKTDNYQTKELSHTITYIPQLYINHIAEKHNTGELNEFILELLLQNGTFKEKYDNFLQAVRQADFTIQDLLNKMFANLDERKTIRKELSETGLPEALTKSIEALKLQIKEITERSTLTEDEKQKHEAIIHALEDLAKQIAKYKACIEFAAKLEDLLKNRITSLVGYDTKDNHIPGEVDDLFAYYSTGVPVELENLVNTIRGDLTDKLNYFLSSIHELPFTKKLEEALKEQGKQKKILEPINKKIEGKKDIIKIQEQLTILNNKLTAAKGLLEKMEVAKKQFAEHRKLFVKTLIDRHQKYNQLVADINTTYSEVDTDIRLIASVEIKREEFPLYDLINKQRATNSLFDDIFPKDRLDVNYEGVPVFIEKLKSYKDGKLSFNDDSECYAKQDVSLKELFTALSENHFILTFDVRYKNDSLFKMSPGKKGTVLLILYLQISTASYPILIDQPEDNLDNRTIYTQLCTMIKRKKSDRQIIIVTHNANLVVGTDSENVIVANQMGQNETTSTQKHRFEYVNGPIEHSFKIEDENDPYYNDELRRQGIREHICDILEGGQEAFRIRERKYGL